MDIQLEKLELIKAIAETEDVSLIKSFKKLLKKEKKDWWENLSDAQNADIEQGERDIENGDYVEFFSFIEPYLK